MRAVYLALLLLAPAAAMGQAIGGNGQPSSGGVSGTGSGALPGCIISNTGAVTCDVTNAFITSSSFPTPTTIANVIEGIESAIVAAANLATSAVQSSGGTIALLSLGNFVGLNSSIVVATNSGALVPLLLPVDGSIYLNGISLLLGAQNNFTVNGNLYTNGHSITGGTSPSFSCTGTGTVTVLGTSNDQTGIITEGTGSTGCTGTFAVNYPSKPKCSFTPYNGVATSSFDTNPGTPSTFYWTHASANGAKYEWDCHQ